MGRKLKDYSGEIHGCWKVIERDLNPKSKSHETFWLCQCQNCGNIASVRKTNLDQNPRSCNNCKGEIISNIFQQKGYTIYPLNIGDKFGLLTVIEKPYTKGTKLYCKCKCDCGNIVDIRKDHLLGLNHNYTISCGCSTKSSGELKIAEILLNYNIEFKEQYRIKEFNLSAPFDFAIFQDGQLCGLIEYDGKQHFSPIDYFGGEETLKIQQERDQKKNKWCKENNINLLRIPYTDYNKIDINYIFPDFPNLKFRSWECCPEQNDL